MALGNVAKAKAEARINFVMVVVFPLSGFCCLENPGGNTGATKLGVSLCMTMSRHDALRNRGKLDLQGVSGIKCCLMLPDVCPCLQSLV
jgi:hypothetical protein